jgi:acyl-[acyl-carrier-protein] desaturase
MRHHLAYVEFVRQIFAIDPSEMMVAFCDMMKYKIEMPAMYLRESFEKKASLFDRFSDVAQRSGVYSAFDYIDILEKLNNAWQIDKFTGLTPEADKARAYLMKLPSRMRRIAERIVVPDTEYRFKWMNPLIVK